MKLNKQCFVIGKLARIFKFFFMAFDITLFISDGKVPIINDLLEQVVFCLWVFYPVGINSNPSLITLYAKLRLRPEPLSSVIPLDLRRRPTWLIL